MKFLGCLALALVACIAFVSATNSTWGLRKWDDQLLLRNNIVLKGRTNLTFPDIANANTRKISFIFARDCSIFGNGGQATINRGGIGHKNVTIILNRQGNAFINMTVEIWGR